MAARAPTARNGANGQRRQRQRRNGSLRDDLERLLTAERIERAIIAPRGEISDDLLNTTRTLKSMGLRVSVLPRLPEVVGSSVELDDVDGITLLGMRRFGLTRSSGAVKRSFDFVGAGLSLLVLAPLLAAIAIAIKLDSRGPVLFRQRRMGRHGVPFEMLKFRTMVDGAEAQKSALAARNEADGGLFKIKDDPRITRVGNRLRQISLDELPQLFNVLRGDMSLVGPRPLVLDEDEQDRGLAAFAARAPARDDRSVAGLRLGSNPAQRDGQDRLSLRRQLVAVAGREDPAADGPVRVGAPRTVSEPMEKRGPEPRGVGASRFRAEPRRSSSVICRCPRCLAEARKAARR